MDVGVESVDLAPSAELVKKVITQRNLPVVAAADIDAS